jgi:2-polyprenyl-3-methyl-5-hydroxy-6-metoxy-1,4-benzoquinol methylase
MSKQNVDKFFDSYAHDFSAIYGNKNTLLNHAINKYFRKSMKLRYAKTIEGCVPIAGKSVIDVGCGPGHYGIALAKRGAKFVYGIDFAQGMIDLAKQNAAQSGVEDKCHFVFDDFMERSIRERFDYAIVMGFMDYIEAPQKIVEKVLSLTRSKAFFSFPVDGGLLGWQRKRRYKKRCDLFMYNISQLDAIFDDMNLKKIEIQKIARDFFITVFME